MSHKTKQLVSAVSFLLIFGSLLALASRYDLQVSHMLADKGLTASRYYSTNFMCNLVEIIGAWPIWTAGAFAAGVLTVYFQQKKGPIRGLGILFFVLTALVAAMLLRDMLKYALRIAGREELFDAPWMLAVYGVFGLASAACLVGLGRNQMKRHMKELLPFALAVICACCCYFLIELIKTPVGRMRFRAMHLIDDYSWFTPWYQVSSAGELLSGLKLPGDYFKSFPSGHTFSASISYLLTMLPDLFEKWKTRKRKILSYVIPIAYTGFVAFFRIAAGAHFFSDVLIGGTMGYLAVQLFRYIFLYKNRSKFRGNSGERAA